MRVLNIGAYGSDVMEIQALLNKIGYDVGPIDGMFGPQTRNAVMDFQENNELYMDGIIGESTYRALLPLLNGYTYYTIQPGDTLGSIATRFNTSVNSIIIANPGINPNNLNLYEEIVVPFSFDIVDTNINYTYEILERDIEGLEARYPFLEIGSAGNSVLGKELYYIRLGTGSNEVFYNASHHANEWITSPLLMKFIESFLKSYIIDEDIRGYDLSAIWENSSIYIIPMVNPDGVDLAIDGLQPDNPYYNDLIQWNDTGEPFSLVWKANIRGVDLNRNYNALWYEYKELSEELGFNQPGASRYPGPYPESEPESFAVAEFTRMHDFSLTMSYHTQGEVIFWDFMGIQPPMAREIGEIFSRASGYELYEPVELTAFYAGYKDWFIQEYLRPGYTIEAGLGVNPLPLSQFPRIYNDNEEMLLLAAIV